MILHVVSCCCIELSSTTFCWLLMLKKMMVGFPHVEGEKKTRTSSPGWIHGCIERGFAPGHPSPGSKGIVHPFRPFVVHPRGVLAPRVASIACIAKAVAVRCWFIASGGFHPSRVVPSAPRPACCRRRHVHAPACTRCCS